MDTKKMVLAPKRLIDAALAFVESLEVSKSAEQAARSDLIEAAKDYVTLEPPPDRKPVCDNCGHSREWHLSNRPSGMAGPEECFLCACNHYQGASK